MKDLRAPLARRQADRLYRRHITRQGRQGARVRVDGKEYLNFCSNDYLGLAAHPKMIAAFCRGAEEYGVGAGASHLICGHSPAHQALQEQLAALSGYPRCLLFSTGYMANIGVLGALLSRGDVNYQDRLNHASLLDAAALGRARLVRYPHCDVDALAERLAEAGGDGLIATDGVFSMEGDIAPLPALAELAAAHGVRLFVDDAHGFGVLGERGMGTVDHFGLGPGQVPFVMGTFGKAFGGFGAFVLSDEDGIETLEQFSRSYIYTTAPPPAQAVAAAEALRLATQEEAWRRKHLAARIGQFRRGARALGLEPTGHASVPIQPLVLGSPERALECADRLWERGIWINAIRAPTVPAGTERLRVALSAAHGEKDVETLLGALGEVLGGPPEAGGSR